MQRHIAETFTRDVEEHGKLCASTVEWLKTYSPREVGQSLAKLYRTSRSPGVRAAILRGVDSLWIHCRGAGALDIVADLGQEALHGEDHRIVRQAAALLQWVGTAQARQLLLKRVLATRDRDLLYDLLLATGGPVRSENADLSCVSTRQGPEHAWLKKPLPVKAASGLSPVMVAVLKQPSPADADEEVKALWLVRMQTAIEVCAALAAEGTTMPPWLPGHLLDTMPAHTSLTSAVAIYLIEVRATAEVPRLLAAGEGVDSRHRLPIVVAVYVLKPTAASRKRLLNLLDASVPAPAARPQGWRIHEDVVWWSSYAASKHQDVPLLREIWTRSLMRVPLARRGPLVLLMCEVHRDTSSVMVRFLGGLTDEDLKQLCAAEPALAEWVSKVHRRLTVADMLKRPDGVESRDELLAITSRLSRIASQSHGKQ